MNAWVILGICVVLAVGIVLGVWRLVNSKDVALQHTRVDFQREKARADAYRGTSDRMTDIADKALDRALTIEKVSTQMDALMFRVAEEDPAGRHHGRHTLRRDLGEELGFGTDGTETEYLT